jgi:hypothetical protein
MNTKCRLWIVVLSFSVMFLASVATFGQPGNSFPHLEVVDHQGRTIYSESFVEFFQYTDILQREITYRPGSYSEFDYESVTETYYLSETGKVIKTINLYDLNSRCASFRTEERNKEGLLLSGRFQRFEYSSELKVGRLVENLEFNSKTGLWQNVPIARQYLEEDQE